jgi:hypothetical protein
MKYEYHIWGSRYGGEHTIGTIPQKVADYWLEQGQDAFQDYMFAGYWEDDKEELNKTIPKEFQIDTYWHDLDNIEHLCTVEFETSNVIIVEELKTGKQVVEIAMSDDLLGDVNNPFADNNDWKGENAVVYGQSFEKGGFDFENLIIDEPFDASKLKLNVSEWDTMKLVNGISYDGQVLYAQGGDTIGKSMAMWIDD